MWVVHSDSNWCDNGCNSKLKVMKCDTVTNRQLHTVTGKVMWCIKGDIKQIPLVLLSLVVVPLSFPYHTHIHTLTCTHSQTHAQTHTHTQRGYYGKQMNTCWITFSSSLWYDRIVFWPSQLTVTVVHVSCSHSMSVWRLMVCQFAMMCRLTVLEKSQHSLFKHTSIWLTAGGAMIIWWCHWATTCCLTVSVRWAPPITVTMKMLGGRSQLMIWHPSHFLHPSQQFLRPAEQFLRPAEQFLRPSEQFLLFSQILATFPDWWVTWLLKWLVWWSWQIAVCWEKLLMQPSYLVFPTLQQQILAKHHKGLIRQTRNSGWFSMSVSLWRIFRCGRPNDQDCSSMSFSHSRSVWRLMACQFTKECFQKAHFTSQYKHKYCNITAQ